MAVDDKVDVNPAILRSEKSFFCRIFHWGPLVAITIIGAITTNTIYCHLQWWPPGQSFAGLLDIIVFLLWNYLCLTNLFRSAYVGPGYVPLNWEPENSEDKQKLQFCSVCEGFKVPRSHHCRKCNRCVMKMDHHCPWINNCCGHKNQAFFVQFLLFAIVGCTHATLVLGPSIYRAIFRVWYMFYGTGKEPIVELGLYSLFGAILAFGMAVGVTVALGFLLGVQMRTILRNRTGIEDYIVAKALHRQREGTFVYPYDLGWKRNFGQVITWTGEPPHDGTWWPVVEECDQFTFTVEQIKQKEEKREHTVQYVAVKDYDGAIFFSFLKLGCKVHCCQPMTEETRLKVNVGDHIMVTRWRRHWLYGQNISAETSRKQRGWFPRKYVVELVDEETDFENTADTTGEMGETENHLKSD